MYSIHYTVFTECHHSLAAVWDFRLSHSAEEIIQKIHTVAAFTRPMGIINYEVARGVKTDEVSYNLSPKSIFS